MFNNNDYLLKEIQEKAAELLDAGRKKEARKVLKEALGIDRNNLYTWELLLRATYNVDEERLCLNRILSIDPNHVAAKFRLAALGSDLPGSQKRTGSPKKKRESGFVLFLLGSIVFMVFVGAAGFALLRSGYFSFVAPTNLTATALMQKNVSCQALIAKAIKSTGDYCAGMDTNKACYGNSPINAELAPGVEQRFSDYGDSVAVKDLRRLSSTALNVDSNEWGIAVFKMAANLPHSLPGENVTMVMFGNTTMENVSSGTENLESFYFSSELGQVTCEKVPLDGLIITSPDGGGVRFNVNDVELTLIGNASIKAIRNGKMELDVYKGSARIVSNGEEQHVGAGSGTEIQLGGPNGNQSVSPPSEPKPLSQEDLDLACTMTGQYCSPAEVIPVSESDAQAQIEEGITPTPSITPTSTLTRIPSPTLIPTNTLLVLPTLTYSPAPKATSTISKTKTPTRTNTPSGSVTPTRTKTNTPLVSNTPTRTSTPTSPFVLMTSTPSNTPTFTSTNTATITATNTPAPVPTATPTAPTNSICSTVSMSAITNPKPSQLVMNITNSSGGAITIDKVFIYWVKTPSTQRIQELLLNGGQLWSGDENFSPSDFPAEGAWIGGADRTIPDTLTQPFVIKFFDLPQATGYEVHIVFDTGCRIQGSK